MEATDEEKPKSRLQKLDSGHLLLKLKKPVQFGEQTITELRFRGEMVAGDMRGIPVRNPMNVEDVLKMGGRLCAQPDPVMDRLGMDDFSEVLGLVTGFLTDGPGGGATS